MKEPTNLKELRSFLGLANWYRKFIKNFAHIANPLFSVCKSTDSFFWHEDQKIAFLQIKTMLCQAPVLAHFDPNLETRLYTDASYVAVGSVLMQVHPQGEKVIAYSSKLLNKAQRNYTVTEIEFYSIICALEKFYTFLIDLNFLVITDHRCIAALIKATNASGRIARWQIRITPFQFTLLSNPGEKIRSLTASAGTMSKTQKNQLAIQKLPRYFSCQTSIYRNYSHKMDFANH